MATWICVPDADRKNPFHSQDIDSAEEMNSAAYWLDTTQNFQCFK
jgi:hypothetical protein